MLSILVTCSESLFSLHLKEGLFYSIFQSAFLLPSLLSSFDSFWSPSLLSLGLTFSPLGRGGLCNVVAVRSLFFCDFVIWSGVVWICHFQWCCDLVWCGVAWWCFLVAVLWYDLVVLVVVWSSGSRWSDSESCIFILIWVVVEIWVFASCVLWVVLVVVLISFIIYNLGFKMWMRIENKLYLIATMI